MCVCVCVCEREREKKREREREREREARGEERFCGENFRGLLAYTAYCPLSLQTFSEKSFVDRYKTAKFAKVFSLENFPLFGIIMPLTLYVPYGGWGGIYNVWCFHKINIISNNQNTDTVEVLD